MPTSAIETSSPGVLTRLAMLRFWRIRGGVVVRVTQERNQNEVDGELPLGGSIGPASYTVPTARVSLLDDGRVQVVSRLEVTFGGQTFGTDVTASSSIRYENGAFFLSGLSFERFDLDGFDEQPANAPETLAARFPEAMATLAREQPIAASKAIIRDRFAKRPVYVLDVTDAKQAVAQLVIRDVSIVNEAITIRLDPVGIAPRVGLGVLGVGVVLVGLLKIVGVL